MARPREYGQRVRVVTRIEPEIADKLKGIARKKGISTNLLVNRIIRRYLERVEK